MKRDWTTRSSLLIIGLILVVVNIIAVSLFFRVDLTDDGVYSLSPASIELVRNLEDPVTVRAFFTSELPAPYNTNRRFLKDKLDDYRAYGGRKVQYQFVDPSSEPRTEEEVRRLGIPPVQIQVIERDNVQLKSAYMGVSIEFGGERETIPVVQDLSTLEYDITSAIRRLTREELPVVGFLSGHGEPSVFQDMGSLRQALARNYDVRVVSLSELGLDPTPDALIVAAPSDTIPDEHLRAIDRYLQEGGRLALLLNQVAANIQQGQATALEVGLEPLLDAWGVGLRTDLVTDLQSSVVTVQQQSGFFNIARQIEYPFLPIASRFSTENMMVNRLREVLFYFVSSIDTSIVAPGVRLEPLVYSSPRSATQQGFFFIQPMMDQRPDYNDGPFTLAAAYTGTFPSAFDSSAESIPTRVVAVGDGDFLNESLLGRIPSNIEFGLNMVDWLVQDEELMEIRAKKVEPRALEDVEEGSRPWIKYANMFGPAIAVVLFGLMRWRGRRPKQFVLGRSATDTSG